VKEKVLVAFYCRPVNYRILSSVYQPLTFAYIYTENHLIFNKREEKCPIIHIERLVTFLRAEFVRPDWAIFVTISATYCWLLVICNLD